MKKHYLLIVVSIMALCGCTAAQWQSAEEKANKTTQTAKTVSEVAKIVPGPVGQAGSGIAEGIAGISAALAAFFAWRKRAATMEAVKAQEKAHEHYERAEHVTNVADALSETLDELIEDKPNPIQPKILANAKARGINKDDLKVFHHESITRRG